MKKLSVEQKAKRYDEVVERAKTEKEKSRNLGLLEFIDENFPELCKSKDEHQLILLKILCNKLNLNNMILLVILIGLLAFFIYEIKNAPLYPDDYDT